MQSILKNPRLFKAAWEQLWIYDAYDSTSKGVVELLHLALLNKS